MSRVFYSFLKLPAVSDLEDQEIISGNIYNIVNTKDGVFGDSNNPIVGIKYTFSNLIEQQLFLINENNENIALSGGYFVQLLNAINLQYIIGVEEYSDLELFCAKYGEFVESQKIIKSKYTIPREIKPLFTYVFDILTLNVEKNISCLLNFKINDVEYKGFSFNYTPSKEPYIFLFDKADNVIGYTAHTFNSFFAGKTFEILEDTDIPKPIYDWLTNYLDRYVDPNMVLNCYKYNSQFNRVDKTDYLTKVIDITGIPRDGFILTHPSFTIELDSPPNFNYVYIEKLNRYFFVEDVIYLRYNLYEIRLKVDVLMTYKDGLKKLNAFIDRNQHTYNEKLIDKRYIFEQGVDVEQIIVPQNSSSPNWLRYIGSWKNEFCFIINGYKINAARDTQ